MDRSFREVSVTGTVVLMLALANGVVLAAGHTDDRDWYRLLPVTGAALAIAWIAHRRHSAKQTDTPKKLYVDTHDGCSTDPCDHCGLHSTERH